MRRLPLLAVLTANAISIVGTSMTLVAVPLFVLRATGSAGSAAVVAAAETAGLGLASALAGPVVDRLGWRRASVVSDLWGAVAVALMPLAQAATGHSVGLLAALAGARPRPPRARGRTGASSSAPPPRRRPSGRPWAWRHRAWPRRLQRRRP
ncbi:hypothetical protein LX15_005178 [Streptoalloteichus tenebrarius]|uniref:Major facilitator superfamily (MFS) profile domain-containing protein n=1 Tax=Streptoalloteichus tenebrarius (strain ATCC 17920 / DSM 40477 / JCM 4838 / CBS 697.72 / NBRC 16177 / NCIMB 11028 / NRRL B-12390 / A12253. 1 / ISP 5477) TaxID=1933 RepID=A0ABT1I0Z9_STRSD|nr:hypothetical protein [Streptoalloteichus tenebrarius]MCP2261452.1 hypothetical protein [Streptoalloteichus tenebrarius]